MRFGTDTPTKPVEIAEYMVLDAFLDSLNGANKEVLGARIREALEPDIGNGTGFSISITVTPLPHQGSVRADFVVKPL